MRLEGLVDGPETAYDGQYFCSLDFEQCEPGECNLHTSADAGAATRYSDLLELMAAYRQVDGRAGSNLWGRPERPLTAFSISIESV